MTPLPEELLTMARFIRGEVGSLAGVPVEKILLSEVIFQRLGIEK